MTLKANGSRCIPCTEKDLVYCECPQVVPTPTPQASNPMNQASMRDGLLKAYELLAYAMPDAERHNATGASKWMDECDAWLDQFAPSKLSALQVETPDDVRVKNLLRALDAKQAKIDALMLEFCPGEMSADQRAEWARSQVKTGEES